MAELLCLVALDCTDVPNKDVVQKFVIETNYEGIL